MYLRFLKRGDIKRFYISDNGNVDGVDIEQQGTQRFVKAALNSGFDCKVDIWFRNGVFLIGDDGGPKEEVEFNFIHYPQLWFHCQNIEALYELLDQDIGLRAFVHQNRVNLVNKKAKNNDQCWIWTPFKARFTDRSIVYLPNEGIEEFKVNPEFRESLKKVQGICSPNIRLFEGFLEEDK